MAQKYEAEIQRLQEEIRMCEAERDDCLRTVCMKHGEKLPRLLQSIRSRMERADGEPPKEVSKLLTEISHLEEDLRKQSEMSGINLTESCVRTLEQTQTKTIQQYRLAGQCGFLPFQVEFALTDIQDGETFMRRITDLNIIADGAPFKDLSSFISSVEETKSLFLLFRTMSAFSQSYEQRRRTFQHFKEKYTHKVHLPQGCSSEVMLIQSPQLPGCTMSIVWRIIVSKEGVVQPKLDLLMKMPEEARRLDTMNVVDSAPESFRSLLSAFGVEAALENLIQTV